MSGLNSPQHLFARLAWEETEKDIAQNRTWPSTLGANLIAVAALERAYSLGYAACTCDVGSQGNEWRSGCGVAPESIADREWNGEPHQWSPGDPACVPNPNHDVPRCVQCGRHEGWFLHKPDPWECTDEDLSNFLSRSGDEP